MDIQQIRYFVKAYQMRNFTQAARELFTSRQALRHMVKTLEEEMDQELFVYEGKGLRPTPAADMLYPVAIETLEAFERFERCARTTCVKHRPLRCGMVDGIHDAYSQEEFFERHAMKTANYCAYFTTDCATLREMLRKDKLDVAYLISDKPSSDEFVSRYDRCGRLYLMVHRSSDLAERHGVGICDLRGRDYVGQGEGYDLHDRLAAECRREGFELNATYLCASPFDAAWQVNDGFGVAVSLHSAVTHLDLPNVVCVPFDNPRIDWYLLHLVAKGRTFEDVDDEYWDTSGSFPIFKGPMRDGRR